MARKSKMHYYVEAAGVAFTGNAKQRFSAVQPSAESILQPIIIEAGKVEAALARFVNTKNGLVPPGNRDSWGQMMTWPILRNSVANMQNEISKDFRVRSDPTAWHTQLASLSLGQNQDVFFLREAADELQGGIGKLIRYETAETFRSALARLRDSLTKESGGAEPATISGAVGNNNSANSANTSLGFSGGDTIPPERQTEPISKAEAGRRLGYTKKTSRAGEKYVSRLMKSGGLRFEQRGTKYVFDSHQVIKVKTGRNRTD